MSNSADLLNKGVFDLRAVLAEQQLPEDEVEFYIDRELGHAVSKLEKQVDQLGNNLAVAKLQKSPDDELIKQAEDALDAAQKKLDGLYQEATPYKALIRAVTRRAKFDLQSKALHAFPIHRDMWGNDDSEQEFARTNYLEEIVWASTIQSITAPDGRVQVINGLDDVEIVQGIHGTLPESAANRINAKINELMDDGDEFEFAAKSEDFS